MSAAPAALRLPQVSNAHDQARWRQVQERHPSPSRRSSVVVPKLAFTSTVAPESPGEGYVTARPAGQRRDDPRHRRRRIRPSVHLTDSFVLEASHEADHAWRTAPRAQPSPTHGAPHVDRQGLPAGPRRPPPPRAPRARHRSAAVIPPLAAPSSAPAGPPAHRRTQHSFPGRCGASLPEPPPTPRRRGTDRQKERERSERAW